MTLINEHRLVCFLVSIKEYSLAPSEGGQNISSFSITSCWIFLKVPTAFPCCSDKMLCPTLLVYSLLFPPLPWSASGGLSACFTDVSSTQLLGCFSSGFLKQMFPCVHAPSFLLTPFLSVKTICCCLSDLERDHPIPQMLIFFLVSLALVHMVSRQYLPLFCSSWLTMLMFCSFNLIFLCYPYTHSFVFFSFSFFPFFFFPVTLCFLCTSGPYGISSSLTTAWERKTSHTNCFTLVTTGNLYANFFFCLGAEKKGQLYIFFKLTQTHMSKIKFTFYSCSEYWLLTLSKETCRDQALWLIWLPF